MRRAAALACCAALAGCASGRDEPIDVPQAQATATPPATRVPFGAAVADEPARADPAYLSAFTRTFGVLALENSTAWAVIQPRRGEFDFGPTDALVDLAEETGKRVRGQLVWDQVLPRWLTDERPSGGELREILTTHVRAIVERYRGRVDEWVVVNEPLEDDGSFTPSLWLRGLGERYVALAFRTARAADPDAVLLLNEIAAERGVKLDALAGLAGRLARAGVPVDAVGLQNHTTVEDPPTRAQLARAMQAVAALGLDVQITEMDVVTGAGEEGLRRQAAVYREAARACVEAARCTGFTVWGVTDPHSWKGAQARALLFDADGRPKPAARAVLDVLSR